MKKLWKTITWPYRKFTGLPRTSSLSVLISFTVLVLAGFMWSPCTGVPEDWEMSLASDSQMQMEIPDRYREPEKTLPVRKGTSVKVLGYEPSSCLLWAETASGDRGFIPQEAFGTEMTVVRASGKGDSRLRAGDEVTFAGREDDGRIAVHAAGAPDSDRIIIEGADAVIPEVLEHGRYAYGIKPSGYSVSWYFEKKVKGRDFSAVQKRYCPASVIRKTPEGLEAVLNWNVKYRKEVSGKTRPAFGRPVLTVRDGKVVSVEYLYTRKAASALSWLPLADNVICDWGFLLRSPVYGNFSDARTDIWALGTFGPGMMSAASSSLGKIVLLPLGLLLLILMLLAYGSYFFAVGWLPAMAVYLLLQKPLPFRRFGNRTMSAVLVFLAVAGVYITGVLMLARGVPMLILLVVHVFLFFRAFRSMYDFFPLRCRECRSVDSYGFDRTEFGKPYDEWKSETVMKLMRTRKTRHHMRVKGRVVSRNTDSYTYIDDDSISLLTLERTERLYRDDRYRVCYKVTPYTDYYRCSCCGAVKKFTGKRFEETGREYAGSGTHTSSSDELTRF